MNKLKRAYRDIYLISKRFFYFSLVTGLLSGLTPFISIYLSQFILNQLSSAKSAITIFNSILIALIIGFIAMTFLGLLEYVHQYEYGQFMIQLSFERNLKLTTMDYQYVEDPEIKQLLWNIEIMGYSGGGSMEAISRNLKSNIQNTISTIVALAFIIPIFMDQSSSMVFLNSKWLTVLFLIILIVVILLPVLFMKSKQSIIQKVMSEVHHLNSLFNYVAQIVYNPESGKEFRIYQQQGKINKPFVDMGDENQAFGRIYKFNRKIQLNSKLISEIVNHFLGAMLYLLVGLKVLTGSLSIGYLVSSTAALSLLISSLSGVVQEMAVYLADTKALDLHYQFMDLPNQTKVGSIPVEKRLDNDFQLSFKNVDFHYPKSENKVLSDINIDLEVGKSYAIVGENGSGKTTFIKLLTRLYDPVNGQVLLNGIDVSKYDSGQYYGLFNVVFQDFDLFSFKLGETISTQSTYDEKKLLDIFKKLGFEERFKKMSKGFETSLNKEFDSEGISLSGGENQKLAIARALYKDGPIFVLDEPTAALDPISEFEIYQQFHKITKGRTSLIISHRLSSCRFCDEIIVFDKGEIVQQGTHEELIVKDGKYRELWNAQAQYYIENEVDLQKLQIN